jgi:regulation of enolase protein 1 (concanavalin A-like superfamily)
MNAREFFRFHSLKILLAFIVIQFVIIYFVQNHNYRPVAHRDTARVIEGRIVKINPLTNDTDKNESDELSIGWISEPLQGTIAQNGRVVHYTPNAGFVGIDSFAYKITDGRKESKAGYIVVQIDKNLAPVATNDTITLYSGEIAVIDVLANDTDNERDSLFIEDFSAPLYGELKRFGNNLIYKSNPNSTVDSFTYTSTDGLNSSNKASVHIKTLSKNHPNYPWLSTDVGDADIAGSLQFNNKSMIITASGSDIWNTYDGFHYVYQLIQGDVAFIVKVSDLEATNEWAKAGIMLRESLAGGSKMALVCITNKNGVATNHRLATNQNAESGEALPEMKSPCWVKLERKGNSVHYYASENGSTWKALGNIEINLNSAVYIGLALTSHNNGELAKAVFTNYNFKGKKITY